MKNYIKVVFIACVALFVVCTGSMIYMIVNRDKEEAPKQPTEIVVDQPVEDTPVGETVPVPEQTEETPTVSDEVALPTDDETVANDRERWQEFIDTNHAVEDTNVHAAFVNTLGEEMVSTFASIKYYEDIYNADGSFYEAFYTDDGNGNYRFFYVNGDSVVEY